MIRNAKEKDAAAICEIYNHYVATTHISFDESEVSVEKFLKLIQDQTPFLVYEVDEKVVGFAYTAPWKSKPAYRFTHESTIYLKSGATNKGVGSSLYKALIEQAKDLGLHSLVACIALPHEQSVHFHEKLEFIKTAHFEEVGFKFDRWLDVGYWQLPLKDNKLT